MVASLPLKHPYIEILSITTLYIIPLLSFPYIIRRYRHGASARKGKAKHRFSISLSFLPNSPYSLIFPFTSPSEFLAVQL